MPVRAMAQQLRDRWARAVLASDLPDELIRTAWAIREYANDRGEATMGIASLARDTGRNRRTVQRHLDRLVGAGYLERHAGRGTAGRGGTTALSVLRVPAAQSGDSMDVTTSRLALNGKGCHAAPEVVTRGAESSDTQGVARTLLNPTEPGAGARATEGAHAAPTAGPEHVSKHLQHMRETLGVRRRDRSEGAGVVGRRGKP
jgi:hypothetical protein